MLCGDLVNFYRAVHFSAKRGLSIACRLSVRLSVRPFVTLVDCDHIGWNCSKIISRLVSLGCSLYSDPNMTGLRQGEHPEIWAQSDLPPVDLSVRDIRSQIAAEWLQIAQRSQWRAYIVLSHGLLSDGHTLTMAVAEPSPATSVSCARLYPYSCCSSFCNSTASS